MPKNRMLHIQNLQKLFDESVGARIINSSDMTDPHVMENFIKNLFYEIDSDIGFIATCECGEYRGNHYEGSVCPYCSTVVSSQFATSLSNVNWIGIPEKMPEVLHPVFYTILKEWIGKIRSVKGNRTNKVPVIQAILNPDDPLPSDIRSCVRQQGFTYFRKHFDETMDFFFNVYKPTKLSDLTPHVKYIYQTYRNQLFTDKLPILHPTLHPLAREGKIKSVDPTAGDILNAIVDLSISGFSARRCITTSTYIDKSLWKIYSKYIDYTENIIVKKLGDKYAQLRRHNTGSRVHFSLRSVIVPIVDRHMGDEIHLPWSIVVNGLKYEIINVLTRRQNYSYTAAIAKHQKSLVAFDQDIYDILDVLMKECPYKGFPVTLGRNPTLSHGAIQLLFNTKVKKNIFDKTIALSPRICSAPNADFDGILICSLPSSR